MPKWQDDAACRTEDETLFFGPPFAEPRGDRDRRETVAKTICSSCPVLVECREHALATAELYGVWGGLGEVERRELLTLRAG